MGSAIYGGNRELNSVTVPVTTLDDLIESYGRPDFLKIDVEGFELDVLKGLSSSVRLLSLEFFSDEMDRLQDCLAILRQLGKLTVRASSMHCDWLGPKRKKSKTV